MTGITQGDELPEFDCVIDPNMAIELSSAVDGVVESIEVRKGDTVTKGQVVARLDAGPQIAAVQYARTRAAMKADIRLQEESLAYGRRNQKRVSALYVKRAISDDEADKVKTDTRLVRIRLDQAREKRRLAQLDLLRAKANLEQYTIRSPIDGVVTERYLNPGESVKDHPLLKIAQIDPLRVEIIVPVDHYGTLRPGQQVRISPEAPMDGRYQGTITIIDPVVDAASGTFRVRVELPNSDHKLTSGLKCKAHFLDEYKAPGPAKPENAQPAEAPEAPSSPEVQPKVETPSTSRSTPRTAQCLTIGPVTSKRIAHKLTSALANYDARIQQRRKKGNHLEASRYLLLTPKTDSAASARKLAMEIRSATGIRDIEPITHGSMKNRVSLGVYTNQQWAEERIAKIRNAGFKATLMPQYNGRPRIWLDVQLSGDHPLPDIEATLRQIAAGVQFNTTTCDALSIDGAEQIAATTSRGSR